jgi:hypothetical protein
MLVDAARGIFSAVVLAQGESGSYEAEQSKKSQEKAHFREPQR